MFGSCNTQTQIIYVTEANFQTPEEVNWSIPIIIESKQKTVIYTIEQAKKHELAKAYICAYQYVADDAPQVSTRILEGVRFSDVLKDIGVTSFSSITVEHNNSSDIFTYDHYLALDEGTVIGWIQNKNMIVDESPPSYVAFGAELGGLHDFCHSIKQITIHA